MYDVICRHLSACLLYCAALEAVAGAWRGQLWFGCPYRCLTDTTGVNISHHGHGAGLWWSQFKIDTHRRRARGMFSHLFFFISQLCCAVMKRRGA